MNQELKSHDSSLVFYCQEPTANPFFSATVQQYGNNNQVPFYEVIARITEIMFVKKVITIKNKRYVKLSVRNVSISKTAVEK